MASLTQWQKKPWINRLIVCNQEGGTCLNCVLFISLQLHELTIHQLIQVFLLGMEFTSRQSASPLKRRQDQAKHKTTRESFCISRPVMWHMHWLFTLNESHLNALQWHIIKLFSDTVGFVINADMLAIKLPGMLMIILTVFCCLKVLKKSRKILDKQHQKWPNHHREMSSATTS